MARYNKCNEVLKLWYAKFLAVMDSSMARHNKCNEVLKCWYAELAAIYFFYGGISIQNCWLYIKLAF